MNLPLPSWWLLAVGGFLLLFSTIKAYHDLRMKLELPTVQADIKIVHDGSLIGSRVRLIERNGILQLQAFIRLYIESQKDESLMLSNASISVRDLFRPWRRLDIPFREFYDSGKRTKQQEKQLQVGPFEDKHGYLIFRLPDPRFIQIPSCITARVSIKFRGRRILTYKLGSMFLYDTRKMNEEEAEKTNPIHEEIRRTKYDAHSLDVNVTSRTHFFIHEFQEPDLDGRTMVVHITITNRSENKISCNVALMAKISDNFNIKFKEKIKSSAKDWMEKHQISYGSKILDVPIDIDARSSVDGCLVFYLSSTEMEDGWGAEWKEKRETSTYLFLIDLNNWNIKEVQLYHRHEPIILGS